MPHLRIATYNINSVRLRLDAIRRLKEAADPDIICLQEIKVEDALFPLEALKKLGYPHVRFSGQKGYNGVAILSRLPLSDEIMHDFTACGHKRHLGVKLADGTEIHTIYIPAGGDVPDPELNPKFDHKLRFCDDLFEWSASFRGKKKRMILLGDFNIAPLEHDVWSHRQLLTVVSHTPVEVERLARLQSTLGWIDTGRHFVPHHEKLYSWWSYRNQDWEKSDRGRRLDHIWVTPELLPNLSSASILREARNWDTPSDHFPVLADFEF